MCAFKLPEYVLLSLPGHSNVCSKGLPGCCLVILMCDPTLLNILPEHSNVCS